MKLQNIHHTPSWVFQNNSVKLSITKTGGHVGPATFRFGDREIQPFHVAPWCGEKSVPSLDVPPLLKILRGDFFCMPFGGNAKPWKTETHPVHGETANNPWDLDSCEITPEQTSVRLSLQTSIRAGHVVKEIQIRTGQPVIYSRHTISGMQGPMCFGHHAMLNFPSSEGSGLLSFSKFSRGQVFPGEIENPAQGGYSSLLPGAKFRSLARVPLRNGGFTDLGKYPAREGFEDIVMLSSAPGLPFAWSAVTFPSLGYGWIGLKDPSILASTVLWHSNGGRHYAPWLGRHRGVLGIEEVTSFFHAGLAESARPNEVSKDGIPTHFKLRRDVPFRIRYIMGCFLLPKGFARVDKALPCEEGLRLSSKNVSTILPVDLGFLKE